MTMTEMLMAMMMCRQCASGWMGWICQTICRHHHQVGQGGCCCAYGDHQDGDDDHHQDDGGDRSL